MSIEGINAPTSPIVLAKSFGAQAARDVEAATASKGTQEIVAQAADTPPAVDRNAREAANERGALTTYEYDPAKRTVGNTSTTGGRVGMFLNTMA